jgi:tRNA 2-selenouridine synthase
MISSVSIEHFLDLHQTYPIFDVRTPAEFARGHIPGARNLPLFSNEERVEIGTLYKKKGRNEAVLRGLELTGPRLRSLVETVQSSIEGKHVLVHCWRGGMRSNSVAWLLDFYGYRVTTLRGGYKAFRTFAHRTFAIPRTLFVLGGKTGSGKTHILRALHTLGEQTIDLEALARHKGSSFGRLGETEHPTQEHFENELAMNLYNTSPERPVWVEDESRKIGWVRLPDAVWHSMQSAPIAFLDIPRELRIHNLVRDYGQFEPTSLAEAIMRLQKQLGGLDTRLAMEALEQGNYAQVCDITLRYYDKTYMYGLSRRDPAGIVTIPTVLQTPESIAKLLIAYRQELLSRIPDQTGDGGQ